MNEKEIINFIEVSSKAVEGWFYVPDMMCFCILDRLQSEFSISGSLCEVGVFKGKSLILLSLLANENETVVGIDLFPNDLMESCERNVREYGHLEKVRLIRSDSANCNTEYLLKTINQPIRILHIDAGHEYSEVFHQLVIFAPFVTQGGLIVMDDYHDREFPGVEAAVLDFCEIDRPRRFVPFLSGGNKIFLCESEHSLQFQRKIIEHPWLENKCRFTRVRDFYMTVAFSKLAVSNKNIFEQIDAANFPILYDIQEDDLAKKSAIFSQRSYGSGRTRDGA